MQVDNGTQSETASLYNLTDNTFKPFHMTELAEAGGHVLLPDGRGLIVGGQQVMHIPVQLHVVGCTLQSLCELCFVSLYADCVHTQDVRVAARAVYLSLYLFNSTASVLQTMSYSTSIATVSDCQYTDIGRFHLFMNFLLLCREQHQPEWSLSSVWCSSHSCRGPCQPDIHPHRLAGPHQAWCDLDYPG